MARIAKAEALLSAAEAWKDQCLIADGSLFSTESLWNPEAVAQLDRYYVQNLDLGEGDFFEKLEKQLGPASTAAKQLAAEMFWVLYLFVASEGMKAGTKRLQIRRVWAWSGVSLGSPAVLGEPMEVGIGGPGTAYNTLRWKELVFLVELIRAFKANSLEERRRLVRDPWVMGQWVDDQPTSVGRQFRHMLLYLLFPDEFERVTTDSQKRQMLAAAAQAGWVEPSRLGSLSRLEVDRGLYAARQTVSANPTRSNFDWYERDYKALWFKDKVTGKEHVAPDDGASQWVSERFGTSRVWVVAAGASAYAWPEFMAGGFVAIGWSFLGDLGDFASKDDILDALQAESGSAARPTVNGLACWQFAKEVRPGDWMVVKKGRAELLGYGEVTGEYQFDPTRAELRHVRSVVWKKVGSWKVDSNHLMPVKTLTEVTPQPEWIRNAFLTMDGSVSSAVASEDRPYSAEDAKVELFVAPEVVDRAIAALVRKKNIVLQGPPGVGKTYAARRIAWALMGNQGDTRLETVQFHQSYAYEDFVQGWRPEAGGGFGLKQGVFCRFCERARQDPSNRYVMIIDEVNRGNLSKIFGELMMLLEADKRGPDFSVQLTYSSSDKDRFFVPENVYVIGAMNTADRSLALVDYALRRRFIFIGMEPAFERDTFKDALLKAEASEPLVEKIVTRLTALNKKIREDVKNLGPGFEIGHSYFVPSDDDESLDDVWYDRVIALEIGPLLREYWFDQPQVADMAIAKLRA